MKHDVSCRIAVIAIATAFFSATGCNRQAADSAKAPDPVVREEQPPEAATWTDPETGLMWTHQDNGSNITWLEAREYCRRLDLAGHTNWRLPTIDQLAGLHDQTQNVHYAAIKGGIRLSACCMWSGNPAEGSAEAWTFAFYSGERVRVPFDFPLDLRALCVRRSAD